MIKAISRLLKQFVLYHIIRFWFRQIGQERQLASWEKNGRPVPPPHIVKQRALLHYARQYDLHVFVETGTYYGDMIHAMRDHFNRLYSIEVDDRLYQIARRRFARNGRIRILHGDSAVALQSLIEQLDRPALFWLDGHYSAGVTGRGAKDTPIYEELTHIFKSPHAGHVIMIDDARCFGTEPGYPTISELTNFIRTTQPNATIDISDDSIRILPHRTDTHRACNTSPMTGDSV